MMVFLKDICDDINDYLMSSSYKEAAVLVPVYSSKWKLGVINRLRYFFSNRGYYKYMEGYASFVNYWKLIPPDEWIESSRQMKVYPEHATDLGSLWEVYLDEEFRSLDLRFGTKPARAVLDVLGGNYPMYVSKETGIVYQFGLLRKIDNIGLNEDYECYLRGNESHINWKGARCHFFE